jgi:hypothetical protein
MFNNTNIENDFRAYYVPLKWQLPSLGPTNDFRMAFPENANKESGHFALWATKMVSLLSLIYL